MWVCWSCCSWRELLLCDTLRCRCRAAVHIGQHVAVRWQHVTAYQYYSAVSTSNCDASLHTAWSWTRCCVDQTTQYVLALCATWVCLSVWRKDLSLRYTTVLCSVLMVYNGTSSSHRSVDLWHCWLGHISLTRKIVSEMTYIVSSGTLNPTTIPYYQLTYVIVGLWSCLV